MAELSIAEAAAGGNARDLLVAMRSLVASTLDSGETAARDLASLTKRLREITQDIEEIDAMEGEDDVAQAADTPDEAFNA